MSKAGRFAKDPRLIVGVYAVFALAVLISTPLWLSEILILAGTTQHTPQVLRSWFVGTPGATPLFYYTQWMFVTIFGNPEITGRVPSLVCALISSWLVWRLAKKVPVQQPTVALLLFLLIPVQFRFATLGLPSEEGLVFLVLATQQFFGLIEGPAIKNALLYAAFLTLCLYTDSYSFLPAIGYLLFLLAFINRAPQRRSMWFVLPATATPALLFSPYYFWAHPQTTRLWLYGSERILLGPAASLDVLREMSASGIAGYILSPLLMIGTFVAGWRALSLPINLILKRVKLFSLFGGVLVTAALAIIVDGTSNTPFWAGHIFGAIPGVAILATAALDWVAFTKRMKLASTLLAALLLITCVAGDIEYATTQTQDMKRAARLVREQLSADSCVVFVSEGLSGYVFAVFEPTFVKRECLNFFHHRVVLASHPWVQPEQQQDAESYFRGLNFSEIKRVRSQGSQLVVMEQH